MLTIKQIEKSGHEGIISATSVTYNPPSSSNNDRSTGMVLAFGCPPDGGAIGVDGVCRYGNGRIYVMNESGSTVAKYDLDDS